MVQTERQRAREQLIITLLEGHTFEEASRGFPVPVKRAMAYRLLRAVRSQGKEALQDGRHGHPSKLRGEVRAFLEEQCRQAPHTPSSTIQMDLRDRFDLHVSISQINRVRATLGTSNHRTSQQQGKKRQRREVLSLSQKSGRAALAVFYSLLLLIKRACSKSCKQLSHQATSPLIPRCVSPALNQQYCTVRC